MTKGQDKRISFKQFLHLFENDTVAMLLSNTFLYHHSPKMQNKIIKMHNYSNSITVQKMY